MYCLERLQRELAYFFDMDLRELPRVQDLLAAQGYTQVQKGDEIIKLEPSAQADSTLESTTQISQEIKDIIDSSPAKGRDIQIIGEANFTPQVVEYAHKNSKKVAKNAVDSQKANPSPAPYGYEPHADANTPPLKTDTDIIPQKTQKSLFDTQESTSNPPPSQPPQAQRLKEALQIPLTDDRGLQSLAFGRVGSDVEIMEQVLIPQARNAHRKGTSQNKLEVAARNALKKHRQDLEQSLNITPIKEFGTNYAEHYRDGKGAIDKLLLEKQGQVSGAFYRKELGDIDLVWGEVQGKGKEAKGWGLAKIIEKHLNAGDFKAFGEGEAGLINAMSEIIQNGKVVTQNGVDSIVLRKNGEEYRVGISKGWDNVGENKWIITSYKNNKYKESAETSYHDTFTSKEPLENLATDIIPQPTQKSLFDTQESTPPKVDSSEAPPSRINFTYTTGEAKGIAELRKDLKAALEPYKSTPITNKETGLQGVVTDTERNKISSKKAVDKSIANGFTRDEHFAAAQDLKNLFENATKAQSHNDYKQRENIAQVHRFVKDLYINDKQAQAKITLFEKIEGKNRIYTLELESLENPTPLSSSHAKAGAAVEAQVTRDVVRPNANIAKTDKQSIAHK